MSDFSSLLHVTCFAYATIIITHLSMRHPTSQTHGPVLSYEFWVSVTQVSHVDRFLTFLSSSAPPHKALDRAAPSAAFCQTTMTPSTFSVAGKDKDSMHK